MDLELQTLWTKTRDILYNKLDRDSYERYLIDIVPLSYDKNKALITLEVLNGFVALWLDSNYKNIITDVLKKLTQQSVTICFQSREDKKTTGNGEKSTTTYKGKKDKKTFRDYPYRPDFTFDSFIIGDNTRVSVAAAKAVVKNPGRSYNPLFIYGGVGLGKTHLLQAIAHEIFQRRRRAKIEYVTSEDFVNRYIDALQSKALPKFRDHFRKLNLLLIDDVQFFERKVGSSEEFFHTFNTLHNAHRQIVMAADRMPQEMDGLQKRLISRFDSGLSAEILAPDIETRVAILKKKQESKNYKFSDDILFLIAKRIRSNIRNLESALTKLTMHVSAFGKSMTLEKVEDLLRDKFDSEASQILGIDLLQRRVAEHFELSQAELIGKKRTQTIASARMIAMYLSRKFTEQSLYGIGKTFNRHYATVIHAVKTVEAKMETDETFRSTIHILQRKLNV